MLKTLIKRSRKVAYYGLLTLAGCSKVVHHADKPHNSRLDDQLREEEQNGGGILWVAARDGNWDAVKRLLHRGAHINEADQDGYTALHYAANKGNEKIAQLLLEHKNIQVNIQNNKSIKTFK